jgi:hypothetical protein
MKKRFNTSGRPKSPGSSGNDAVAIGPMFDTGKRDNQMASGAYNQYVVGPQYNSNVSLISRTSSKQP